MSDETKKPDDIKAPTPPKAEKPKRDKGVIRVVATQSSRWRIGRQFGPEPVEIAAEELSEDDLARLKADPLLVVTASSGA